jgi:hypothetical protein
MRRHLSWLGAAIMVCALAAFQTANAQSACPAIGSDTGCAAVITITSTGGTLSVTGQGPYSLDNQTLVGVVNNSALPVYSIDLASTLAVFAFSGEGIDTFGAPKNAQDNTGYGGPNTFFTNINASHTTGRVNFITPIAANGGTVYFSLENVLTAQSVTVSAVSNNTVTSPLLAAVLPASRSVKVGVTATAFATIINTGAATAPACFIAVANTSLPLTAIYQTTNPTTNALTGPPSAPVDIPAGGSQSFVIALTPSAVLLPTNITLVFGCANTGSAPSYTGLNTLLLSASTNATPDVVALAATSTNDGILHVSGPTGSGAFATATVNVGAAGSITASAKTGATNLPLTLNICQTNPASGQCLQTPAPTVTVTIAANATPTFSIFATASGAIPLDPANSRIFVTFSDTGGTVRGETSVAVQTQ